MSGTTDVEQNAQTDPPELAGRDRELSQFEVVLERHLQPPCPGTGRDQVSRPGEYLAQVASPRVQKSSSSSKPFSVPLTK